MRWKQVVFMCLFMSLIPFTAYGAVSSKIVAVVNGEMISSLELEKRVAPVLMQNGIKNNAENAAIIDQANRQVLQQMIEEMVLLQAAAAQNLTVSDAMVKGQLAEIIANSQLSETEYYKQAAKAGLTPALIYATTKNNLMIQQLIAYNVSQKVVVTQNEIENYYNSNKSDLGHSVKYHIALIMYPSEEDAAKYSKQIADGKISFAEAAKKVSVGPNPANGGDLGTLSAEDMAPELLAIVETLKEGTNSPLIPMAFNQAQVRLISKEDTQKTSGELDAYTAKRIEQMIMEPRLEARLAEYVDQLYKKAIIDIRY